MMTTILTGIEIGIGIEVEVEMEIDMELGLQTLYLMSTPYLMGKQQLF